MTTKLDYQNGDRVYRYVWTGGTSYEPQTMTVERVGRTHVFTRTDEGTLLRIHAGDLYRVNWDEEGIR